MFPNYRKEMKGIAWGVLYNTYGDKVVDPDELEARIKELMLDDDVTNKKGIYHYVLSGEEKHLNLRAFTEAQKRLVYERQWGVCPQCRKEHRPVIHYDIGEMEADHITPWSEGGKTHVDNCQLLCKYHNRKKSNN